MSKKKQRQQKPEDLGRLFKESDLQTLDGMDTVRAEFIPKDNVGQWEYEGIPCHYARFHQPVPPYVNKEPVSEFKVKSDADKYKVDLIVYTPHGLIWTANGETNIVPLANVIYVRTIIS